jgi:hypothetical protein
MLAEVDCPESSRLVGGGVEFQTFKIYMLAKPYETTRVDDTAGYRDPCPNSFLKIQNHLRLTSYPQIQEFHEPISHGCSSHGRASYR